MKKFKLLMVVTIASMLVTSCGQDSKSSSGGYYSGWGTGGSGTGSGATGMNDQGQALYNSLANNNAFACATSQSQYNNYTGSYMQIGQRRSVIVAHVKGNYYGNSTGIYGQIQEGMLQNESNEHYVGINAFGDFLIATKVVNGNSVVGYNLRLSLCSRHFSYQNYTFPIISDSRQLQGIQFDSGMILTSSTSCPAGTISSANFTVGAASYQYSQPMPGTLQPVALRIGFAPPGCASN